jgi:hypothetical protein
MPKAKKTARVKTNIIEVEVHYSIVSDKLNPDWITEKTGITPTKSWYKGQPWHWKHVSIKTGKLEEGDAHKTNGVWSVSSLGKVRSLDFNTHITYLLALLEPVKKFLRGLIKKRGYRMFFYVYKSEYGCQSSYCISAKNLNRMASLCQEVQHWCRVVDEEERKAGCPKNLKKHTYARMKKELRS